MHACKPCLPSFFELGQYTTVQRYLRVIQAVFEQLMYHPNLATFGRDKLLAHQRLRRVARSGPRAGVGSEVSQKWQCRDEYSPSDHHLQRNPETL